MTDYTYEQDVEFLNKIREWIAAYSHACPNKMVVLVTEYVFNAAKRTGLAHPPVDACGSVMLDGAELQVHDGAPWSGPGKEFDGAVVLHLSAGWTYLTAILDRTDLRGRLARSVSALRGLADLTPCPSCLGEGAHEPDCALATVLREDV